jgi:hypothetical protein
MPDNPNTTDREEKEFILDENERPVRCRRERWTLQGSASQLFKGACSPGGIGLIFLAVMMRELWGHKYSVAVVVGAPTICWFVWWFFFRTKSPND